MIPNVGSAIRGLGRPVELQVVKVTVEDHEAVETIKAAFVVRGVLHPSRSQSLVVKPEGQRDWKYWDFFVREHRQSLSLGWSLFDSNGRLFRVMDVEDWTQGGFCKYALAERPQRGD